MDVATAASWAELEEVLEKHHSDVAVVDLLVGSDSVFPHLDQLVAAYDHTRFIVCTRSADDEVIERALVARTYGIVAHDIGVGRLTEVILATCKGQPWPEGSGTCAIDRRFPICQLGYLTARQKQVFHLLKLGRTHKEIAKRLGISMKTVEHHVCKVRKGFGLAKGVPGPWEKGHRGRKRGG